MNPQKNDPGEFDPHQFDPDWARNQPEAPPEQEKPAPARPLLQDATVADVPELARTTPGGGSPHAAQAFGKKHRAHKRATPARGAATLGNKRATPGGGHPHLELQEEHAPALTLKRKRTTGANTLTPEVAPEALPEETPAEETHDLTMEAEGEAAVSEAAPDAMPEMAPDLPEGMDAPPIDEPVPEEPRVYVDFENLPEFVAQREMLRQVKKYALIASIVITLLVLYFVFFAGQKTVVPIVEELKKDRHTEELMKKVEEGRGEEVKKKTVRKF